MKKPHWKLIQLRKEINLTQKEMAEKLEINITTYRKKENGQLEFKYSEMLKLREILGKSLDDIFFNQDCIEKCIYEVSY